MGARVQREVVPACIVDRRVIVRPMRASDADGLNALYLGLSPDDRFLRFFSIRPPRGYAEDWARVEETGGYALVAVADDVIGERIVGEAGYSLRHDGEGELGITVASGWRGGLGTYLLGQLLEAAAARGVANIRADILRQNTPMLTLAGSRGSAVLDLPDLGVVCLVMGTTGCTPVWPLSDEHARVLVEAPLGWRGDDILSAGGFHVMACPGPGSRLRRYCPVLEGRPCRRAADADVIVFALRDDAQSRKILAAHRSLHPGVQLCMDAALVESLAPCRRE